MKKVFFLLNNLMEFDFLDLIKKYMPDVKVSIGENFPDHSQDYDLIILWSYRKILPDVKNKNNIIIFHSSDLPEGKGWAPIYNSITGKQNYYTISGILADEKVDAGDIIVKARFELKDSYTAEYIRKWDTEISLMLTKEILLRFDNKNLKGMKQEGEESFYSRRRPADNEVLLSSKLSDIVDHLRACESMSPSYFMYNNIKYLIRIEPADPPAFPDDLSIIFYA